MKTEHHLKTWPIHFQATWDGRKTAEVRVNDRGYEEGHALFLEEYDLDTASYSGRIIQSEVTHVLYGPAYGIAPGLVVMSTRPLRGYDGDRFAWGFEEAISDAV